MNEAKEGLRITARGSEVLVRFKPHRRAIVGCGWQAARNQAPPAPRPDLGRRILTSLLPVKIGDNISVQTTLKEVTRP
jgi:hypothetical protein